MKIHFKKFATLTERKLWTVFVLNTMCVQLAVLDASVLYTGVASLCLCGTGVRSALTFIILCYKIVFGLVNVQCDEFFAFSILSKRGHPYKFVKASCSTSCRSQFFNQRIVNVWNSLPYTVDFTSLTSFKRTINNVDYSDFLKVF